MEVPVRLNEMPWPILLPGEIHGGKIVSSMHKGFYKEMEKPYTGMATWISENGYEPTGVAYEYYYNSPEDVPESELLTRIVMPVK